MGVGGQCHAPAALHTGRTWYLLYSRLGGPQSRSGRVRKVSPHPPPGFIPRTMQPVVSSYTNCAILVHAVYGTRVNINCNANFIVMAFI